MRIVWNHLGGDLVGLASWWTIDGRRTRCKVTLDSSARWSKRKVCGVVVHEYGHLAGREHSDDPASVMYPSYGRKRVPKRCT